jgi:hypothetical protein
VERRERGIVTTTNTDGGDLNTRNWVNEWMDYTMRMVSGASWARRAWWP